ncbi:betaine/proline/choline family ABC transporter ATP-binding protein [Micromonospora avicenniae]|uniref:ABC-type quaternary amine transporter n=1 Tax=Micromonospora avicenniae TaxID=1198245 RepID=A0A1N7DEB5_9ACTN|nr:betaine/proline/choline family ABC transporter ATP-binding protein [Micromonospora avicenniae]SIR74148.1 osmoprotectant transport system ATP-binding protein [Micromonospora avicenniae]
MPAHEQETATAASIRLESLTKRYAGQAEPAVDNITMDIPAGEIVVLVGPSGCGKTTSLKMINRIIEPTSGRIFIDGEDVTHVNADQLRRRIGYVIQQIGLFPHMTIAENIGMVPRLLGWNRARISERVDELLDLVGMEPSAYRARYPKELSGGQRQRVGVARAMSADPPLLLMDEPFGAIDPITRERLQNEFLRLQSNIRKTIVFVTHDIDEAIKLGDRIAILTKGSKIAQYDTPEAILTAPANDFVADFIGSGASLKRLSLSRVRDVELNQWAVGRLDDDRAQLRQSLTESDHGSLLLLDEDQRPVRWVTGHDLTRSGESLDRVGLPATATVEPHATLHDALNEMVTSRVGCAIVVDDQRRYQGIVDMRTVMRAIDEMRESSQARDRHAAVQPMEAG